VFSRLGRFVYRRRRPVIMVWIILVLAGAVFAPRAGSQLRSTVGEADTEASIGLDLLERDLGFPPTVFILVYSSDELTVDAPRFGAEVKESIAELDAGDGLVRVDSFFETGRESAVSEDRHMTYVLLWFDMPIDESVGRVPEVLA